MVDREGEYFVCKTCKYRYPSKEHAETCEDNCRSGTFDPDLEDYGIPPEVKVEA
tara:strand:+ start:393 stop:554 length:162 start_codon:yes stop_codon:yes gene_type:complete